MRCLKEQSYFLNILNVKFLMEEKIAIAVTGRVGPVGRRWRV